MLAKIPRETTKTKDITGGLPRVVELFEARKPKDPAVISEIDGMVKEGGVVKGQRKMIIVPDEATEPREYSLPRGVHVNVHEGERVRAGEQLMDGPSNPHDILRVLGEKELQKYLVNEIQEVYRLQGVNINDKHIEVISRQMMRWVQDRGRRRHRVPDRRADGQVPLPRGERAGDPGGRPAGDGAAAAARDHQGVALDRLVHLGGVASRKRRASCTEASISGKIDHLRGLKENVTMGRLIPAGTGFEYYRHVRIPADEPPPPPAPPQPSEDDLDLDREIEYAFEAGGDRCARARPRATWSSANVVSGFSRTCSTTEALRARHGVHQVPPSGGPRGTEDSFLPCLFYLSPRCPAFLAHRSCSSSVGGSRTLRPGRTPARRTSTIPPP